MTSPSPANVYLDANIIIDLIEGFEPYRARLEQLATAIETEQIVIVTSELSLADALVKPMKVQNAKSTSEYVFLLSGSSVMRMVPVGRDILMRSAEIRAAHGGKLADAIHVASAEIAGCKFFLTRDEGVRVPPSIIAADLDSVANNLSSGGPSA